MRIVTDLNNVNTYTKGLVTTIGNFDGVHLGHRALIKDLKTIAKQLNTETSVIVFEPQPKEFFSPSTAPVRVTSFAEKALLLESLGVDQVICLRFDQQLANLSAQEFVHQILHRHLNALHVHIGDDFKFGRNRSGDFSFLKSRGLDYGFSVTAAPTCYVDQERVSSTRIRRAMVEQNWILAHRLLGH